MGALRRLMQAEDNLQPAISPALEGVAASLWRDLSRDCEQACSWSVGTDEDNLSVSTDAMWSDAAWDSSHRDIGDAASLATPFAAVEGAPAGVGGGGGHPRPPHSP